MKANKRFLVKQAEMIKVDLGSIDEFYSVTPNYKGFRVTFWAFPVKDTNGNDVYLVIEDQFIGKDSNGNPASFSAPAYRFYMFSSMDEAKRYCEFETHVQYLINQGMCTYDAMSAAMARQRRRTGSGEEVK